MPVTIVPAYPASFEDRFSSFETIPALIPDSPEDVFTSDVWLEEITLTCVSGDAHVTISDKQATPRQVLYRCPVAGAETKVIRFGSRYCPGGISWVADAPDVVVGYLRVHRY